MDSLELVCVTKLSGGGLMNKFGSSNMQSGDEWSKVLSHSEFKVALLVARGLSNKKVARELGVKEGTVKVHLNRVFRKLGAKRRHDLAGMTSPSKVSAIANRLPKSTT
jgi:DNA-binding CsgD family transcriptional regulator